MKECCDMKGFLSFIVLRLIMQRDMSGNEVRKELEKRKGTKPSPGTVYPVLKSLCGKGWIREAKGSGREKKYAITPSGRKEASAATKRFLEIFCDVNEFRK